MWGKRSSQIVERLCRVLSKIATLSTRTPMGRSSFLFHLHHVEKLINPTNILGCSVEVNLENNGGWMNIPLVNFQKLINLKIISGIIRIMDLCRRQGVFFSTSSIIMIEFLVFLQLFWLKRSLTRYSNFVWLSAKIFLFDFDFSFCV